jgi:3',5'-cyclic AMP phosphodiesterase CpdA
MFSILHISDLHRSPDEPVDNHSLIAALLNDLDRYMGETPVVPSPDAVVVSGDLVQGVRLGEEGWKQNIRRQYQVASEFLDVVVREFLCGTKVGLW